MRALALLAALATVSPAFGQAPEREEPGSREAIARFTSEARFGSPWVAYVPEAPGVPSPTAYLGHLVGAPGALSHTAKIHGYLKALAAASPRVHAETIGRTEEGREILLVAIADEAGIRDLEALKAATAALADPRRASPEGAERLIASATSRPIYYLNAGLHADESGSAEMAMELAHRLAVSELPMIQAIRRELVVLINPVAEPDGRDKMADWFHRHLKGRTDYAALPRQSPPYWNRYVFVDINRDAHQQAFAATRAVHDMFHAWHPQVVHDLHEALPLLQTWNGTGPYNPHLDPIVTSQFLEMSFHEVTRLTAMGMPGVWTWNFGESFGQHYLDSVAMNHNAIGRGYETFGNATAETVQRDLSGGYAGSLSREWYRPLPPPKHFRWGMRDNVNYQQTAILAILDWTARHADDVLRHFYRTGFNSWRKGVSEPPFAFVIPDASPDRLRVAGLVNRLLDQRIEVGRLAADLETGEGRFARGSFVVRLDQPYRNYAVDLLTPQRFPDSENIPYDDVSWALPVGFGVEAVAVADARVKAAVVEALRAPVVPAGSVGGAGPVYALRDSGQEALLAARFRLADFAVEVARQAFVVQGAAFPAGSWLLRDQPGLRAALEAASRELALDFVSIPAVPDGKRDPLPLPRLGLFVPWADTDAMGWLRLTLDRHKIPYTYLRDEDVRAGGLREKLDVIVYGPFSRLGSLAIQVHGIAPADAPLAFDATEESPHLGQPVASQDISGGPGYVGLEALRRFAQEGGTLVTLGTGSTLALEGGLVRGVRRAEAREVFTPGSELRLRFADPAHPLAWGYGAETSVFRGALPVYEMPRRWLETAYCTSCLDGPEDPAPVVALWGGSGAMVVSGGMRGEAQLAGKPAILDFAVGRGRVVAFNFSPVHRDMNRSDHRLLWNAILAATMR